MDPKLRVHVVILATLVAAQMPCAAIAASPQMEPVLKAIDPSQAQYDEAPTETPPAQSGSSLNQGGPISGAPVSGKRPALSRGETPQLDQGRGGTYPSELQIPEFGQPLPQVPAGQQPGPRDGGQSWATNQVVPAQPAGGSADEMRVAKLEQSAFGATYPEHEVEDRIDHLEKEILGNKSTAPIADRLSKLEQKLGGGQGAFGSGGASPAGRGGRSGQPSVPSVASNPYGQSTGSNQYTGTNNFGGTTSGANPSSGTGGYGGSGGPQTGYGGSGGGQTGYGGSSGVQPGYGGSGSAQTGYGGSSGVQPGYGGAGGGQPGGTVAYSASQPPQSPQYRQPSGGGGGYGANPSYPTQPYGGVPGSSYPPPGYPQQYTAPPAPPTYRATPYGNPYQPPPAYSPPPYGTPSYAGAPQAIYPAPQGLYPPYGVAAAPYPPATVAYAPTQAPYGAAPMPYGSPYGYPAQPGAAPPVANAGANPADFPGVIRNIPSDPRAGDYFGAIYKFPGSAVARWNKFPVKVHLPAGSPESWQKSLEGGVKRWGQYIPLKIAAANESADIEISWVNHLTPKLLGVTRLQVLKGHLQVQIFLLRPTYYLPEIPERTLQSAFLHELGHALGLFGHSDQPDDLMFNTEIKPGPNGKPSQVRYGNISARDLNTIKKLYEAPPVPPAYNTERPLEWGTR